MQLIRYTLLLFVGAFSLGAIYGVVSSLVREPVPATQAVARLVAFNLVDQNGTPVNERDFAGRPAVVFFGFTYCPEICPATLAELTAAIGQLGADADQVRFFFVTVDPARDTPSSLKKYLEPFDPRIRALTGDEKQVAALARGLGVFFERSGGGTDYSVDHTASVLLLDANGGVTGTLPTGAGIQPIVERLRQVVGPHDAAPKGAAPAK